MSIYDLSIIPELKDYAVIRDVMPISDFKKLHIKHTNLYYISDLVPSLILLSIRDGNQYLHLPLIAGISYLSKEETIEAVKNTYEYLKIRYT
jgi:hypothetical protein